MKATKEIFQFMDETGYTAGDMFPILRVFIANESELNPAVIDRLKNWLLEIKESPEFRLKDTMLKESNESITKLAFKIAAKVEDFIGLVEENLPKEWEMEWFDCESDDDDLERKELLVERSLWKKNKNYEIYSIAYADNGYSDCSYIIIGAPSFKEIKTFLEELLKKAKK